MSPSNTAFPIDRIHSTGKLFFTCPHASRSVRVDNIKRMASPHTLERRHVLPDLPGIRVVQEEEQMDFVDYYGPDPIFYSEEWTSRGKCTFEVGTNTENTSPFFIRIALPAAFIETEADRLSCMELLWELPTAALPETIETLTELRDHYHSLENPSIRRPTPPPKEGVRARVLSVE